MTDLRDTGSLPDGAEMSRTDAEMRSMIQTLLNKVDSLERQLATQGRAATSGDMLDGEAAFEDDDGFVDYGSPADSGFQAQESVTGGDDAMPRSSVPAPPPAGQAVPTASQGIAQPVYGPPPVHGPIPQPQQESGAQAWPAQQSVPYGAQYANPYAVPYGAPPQGVPDGFQPAYAPMRQDATTGVGPEPYPSDAAAVSPDAESTPWRRLSEGNIGRYGTGIMAALLIIMGVWAGAQVVWSQIPAITRMLALMGMGVLVEGAATAMAARSDDGRRNGFLTSLSATGAIVSFLSLAIGGMLYGLYGPPLMGVLFMLWFFGQTMVARLVRSRLFYAVTYVGGAVTMVLEATQVLSSANLVTCVAFSMTSLIIPLVGLADRKRNPAVPYASAVFSLISASVAIMLVGVTWEDRATLITTPEFTTMGDWLIRNIDIAILAITGFVSGFAVTAGTRGLPSLDDMSHVAVKVAFGTLGLFLMLRSATCLPWDCGFVPNLAFCLSALLLLAVTDVREIRVPAAFLSAYSMWHVLDGTGDLLRTAIGTPIAGVLPALAVSCVLPLLPAVRSRRENAVATMVFVVTSCLPMLSEDWSAQGVAYALPVTVLAVFACLATFRLAMAWIGMHEEAAISGISQQSIADPRAQGAWLATKRRAETARRLVPLGIAFLASLSFMPVIYAQGSPVAPDVAPAIFSVLVSLHMLSGIGFGKGWGLPGTEQETRGWRGFQGQYSADDDMVVARTVRGWNLGLLFLAYAWAIVAHGRGAEGVVGIVGDATYSLSLMLVPSTLIAHATSRRSLWAVIASTALSHLSFCLVAGIWFAGAVGLVASCLSIALAMAFVGIGFKTHKGDIRMTGLVTMILFVLKIALFDLPKAATTEFNVLLLMGTGILCFAISFAYNRIDRAYGDDDGADIDDGFEDYVPETGATPNMPPSDWPKGPAQTGADDGQ